MKTKPQREMIYQKIVEYINTGRISTGERLTEVQLANQFHVSRTPVREALLQLEKKGILDLRLNSGAVVKKITFQQMEEIYDIISVLEGYAVESVSARGMERSLAYLHRLERDMERCASKNKFSRYAELNRQFHEFFVKETKNVALLDLIKDLRTKILSTIRLAAVSPTSIDKYLRRHRMILKAISQKKPSQAGAFMQKHIQETKGFASAWLTVE